MLSVLLTGIAGAARAALRRPGFTAAVVGTLAAGIGFATAAFGVVDSVLWRPLPIEDPDRAVMVWGRNDAIDLGFEELPVHGTLFSAIRDGTSGTLEAVAAFKAAPLNIGNGTEARRVDGIRVTAGFFTAVGVQPFIGRGFTAEDELAGGDRVVVLGHGLWRERFAMEPGIVGSQVRLNGEPYTVVGVAPPGFTFPRGGEMPTNFQLPPDADLWVPMAPAQRGPSDLAVVARLAPGRTVGDFQVVLDRISAEFEERFGIENWFDTRAVPLLEQAVGRVRPMLFGVLGAALLVLLVTALNAGQLLLASTVARQGELAVRGALGAGRGRLIQGLAAEAAILGLGAAVAGTALAYGLVHAARVLGPARLPRLAEVTVEPAVLLIAVAVATATGFVFTLVPAVAATRVAPAGALRTAGRAGSRALPSRVRNGVLATELALSVALLFAAGLLVRSVAAEYRTELGFEPAGVLTFEVTLPPARYPEEPGARTYLERDALVRQLGVTVDRLRALPGVRSASLSLPLPLSGAQEASVFTVEGAPVPADQSLPIAEYAVVGSDFFATLGAPLLRGREFTPADGEDALPVVVVNSALADLAWPGDDPIGKRLKLPPPNRPWMTVVGVAQDVKQITLRERPRPAMYVPYTQGPYPSLATTSFVVRTDGSPMALVPTIRSALREVDPEIPVAKVRSMDELVSAAVAEPRAIMILFVLFASAAAVLSAVGVAGLVGWLVAARREELGLRLVLGAPARSIVTEVLRGPGATALVGVAAGVALALMAGQLLRGVLFGIASTDVVTLLAAPALLLAAVLLGCVPPLLGALRVEPGTTLRGS